MSDRRGGSGQRPSGGASKGRDDRGDRHRGSDRNSSNAAANRSSSGRRRSPESQIRIPDKTPQNFTLEIPKKKFTGRCRLFVGNLANDTKEDELKKMFAEFGEINECFSSGKGFAFLRLDTRAHAEAAKETMDGKTVKGRQLRVRFAVHGAALKVKELSSCVSNEMLYHTFSVFGDVERAVHIVDERGKPTGEGIVEFERKSSAQEALKNIEDRVFIMTAQSHPLRAELLEPKDDEDGLAERMISRTPQTLKEREMAPHFADNKSFEFVYGQRWKELYKHERERRAQVEEELQQKRRQLEQDMEIEYEDYRAQMLREDLERQRKELERLEAARRDRQVRLGPGNRFGDIKGNPIIDGPHGRPPPTYGRDPGHNGPIMHDRGPPPLVPSDNGEMKRILQHFNAPEPHLQPPSMGIDPHAIGVQRSLNQSLGLGDPLMPPQQMGPPPGMGPPLGYGNAPSFFNGPPSLMHNIIAPPQDYRPDNKRPRR